jgi:flagellin-like hook-associated protein FlgL
MSVINTNTKALFSQQALKATGRSLSTAMQQLSTGKRINSAGDDAAGMAISTRMTQQIRALNQSVRNAGDAVALIQTVEGATNAITDMLQRMRELAIQAVNDTNANDQRSYLDLEFQQLKKEIVRIADMTEWNGFPILNGSAGERVGERPVYKITSDAQFNSSISYAGQDPTSNALSGGSTVPVLSATGDWKKAGSVELVMSGATVSRASFRLADGTALDLSGAVTATSTNVLTIDGALASAALGFSILSGNAVLTQHGGAGSAVAFNSNTVTQVISRTFMALDELESSDLFINGRNINATAAGDDTVSFSNNAGSAIAKAAVINREFESTGVRAVVNPTIMTGSAMTSGAVVTGTVTINGIVSAPITTVLDNPRETRAAVVDAINAASHLTGVVAYDTGENNKGIRLEATDGRNIEVGFNTTSTAAVFAARTGLKEGIQSGTYSLETTVEGKLVITTDQNGDVTRSGLPITTVYDNPLSPDIARGDFTENKSVYVAGARAVVTAAADIKPLTVSDLVINGVAIRATVAADDTKSDLTSSTSSRSASSLAIATAINAHTSETGVTAIAGEAMTTGTSTTSLVDGVKTLFINGKAISVSMLASDTDAERRAKVITAVNSQSPQTGAYARDTGSNGITISTVDGRNLSIWHDSSVAASEFGLGGASGVTGIASASATSNTAATIYGKVILTSQDRIKVEAGFDGFNSDSNFTAIGFEEGTFGGEVVSADGKMSPPRTGRLAFQVGAAAGQLITIDLADFGKGGLITGAITADVNDPGVVTTKGTNTTRNMTAGNYSLYVNSVEVAVSFGTGDTVDQRNIRVKDAINLLTAQHGIRASFREGVDSGLTLTNTAGQNLSVWYDSDVIASASEFGLGNADGVTGSPGVTAQFAGAKILYPDTNNIRSAAHATAVLSKLDRVMDNVNANRANMGAVINRLTYAMDNLSNVSTNSAASRSQIEDADYAQASTELARTQIMQQAATAVLAQANMNQQTVL